jgi:hypothetical protein
MNWEPRVRTPTWPVSESLGQPEVRARGRQRNVLESSMGFEGIGEIIATRRLYFLDEKDHKRTVSVFVGKPQESSDSPGYHCPFQVIGIGGQETHLAQGLDSIHALQSAMILIAAHLNQLNDEIGGKLSWEGGPQRELGFL